MYNVAATYLYFYITFILLLLHTLFYTFSNVNSLNKNSNLEFYRFIVDRFLVYETKYIITNKIICLKFRGYLYFLKSYMELFEKSQNI